MEAPVAWVCRLAQGGYRRRKVGEEDDPAVALELDYWVMMPR